MLTMLPWKKLSQTTATTVIGVAMLAAFGTSKANAVSLQSFNISGTFADSFSSLSNGSFDGTYTVDVDQLPTTTSVNFENWNISIRDSLGVIRDSFSPSPITLPGFGSAFVNQSQVVFNFGPSPSSFRQLTLFVDSDFTGISTGRSQLRPIVFGSPILVFGTYIQGITGGTTFVTSFKSEPVPEPFTVGGTAVAGAMGLWLKRKQQKSSQKV